MVTVTRRASTAVASGAAVTGWVSDCLVEPRTTRGGGCLLKSAPRMVSLLESRLASGHRFALSASKASATVRPKRLHSAVNRRNGSFRSPSRGASRPLGDREPKRPTHPANGPGGAHHLSEGVKSQAATAPCGLPPRRARPRTSWSTEPSTPPSTPRGVNGGPVEALCRPSSQTVR